MALVPVRLRRECVRVLGEPLIATRFDDGLDECRLGHRGDVDPEIFCVVKRLGIKRQRGLAFGSGYHAIKPHFNTV